MAVKRRKKSETPPEPRKRQRKQDIELSAGKLQRQRQARLNRPLLRSLDPNGIYGAACIEFANDLGYESGTIWQTWTQLVLLHAYEQRIPQAAAEERAWCDVKAVFDKRGCQPS